MGQPECPRRWSVGGLAGHLASQVPTTVRVLATTRAGEDPIPLHEHYHRAAWVDSAVDDEVSRRDPGGRRRAGCRRSGRARGGHARRPSRTCAPSLPDQPAGESW